MEKRNHLHVFITGTYVDDDGEEQEINVVHEDVDFLAVNTFKEDADSYVMNCSVAGRYNVAYLDNILDNFIEKVGDGLFIALLDHVLKRRRTAQDVKGP